MTDKRPHISRRVKRYGNVTRGWDWKTTPELLEAADTLRVRLGIDKTQMIEDALREYIEKHAEKPDP